MQYKKEFSFIVPTNKNDQVEYIIRSLLALPGWNGNDCEVLVVVNNCSESFYEALSGKFTGNDGVKIFFIGALGSNNVGIARNFGIEKAVGRYCIHLDSACVLNRNYLRALKKTIFRKKPQILRGVNIHVPTNGVINKAGCVLKNLAYSTRKTVCYTPNLIVRRDVYEKVGLFDTNVAYGEDTEWSLRLDKLRIHPVYEKGLITYDYDRSNSYQVMRRYLEYGKARFYRFNKRVKKIERKRLQYFRKLYGEIPKLDAVDSRIQRIVIIYLYLLRDFGVAKASFGNVLKGTVSRLPFL